MSLDRARAQQKGSPKQCPGFSNGFLLIFVKKEETSIAGVHPNGKLFNIANGKNIFAFENSIFCHINFCQSRKLPLWLVALAACSHSKN
jgi:hypothetical protein